MVGLTGDILAFKVGLARDRLAFKVRVSTAILRLARDTLGLGLGGK